VLRTDRHAARLPRRKLSRRRALIRLLARTHEGPSAATALRAGELPELALTVRARAADAFRVRGIAGRAGPLDTGRLGALIRTRGVGIVLDATHPVCDLRARRRAGGVPGHRTHLREVGAPAGVACRVPGSSCGCPTKRAAAQVAGLGGTCIVRWTGGTWPTTRPMRSTGGLWSSQTPAGLGNRGRSSRL
jgi:hypothetical protein